MGTGGARLGAGRPAFRPTAESYRKLDVRRMAKAHCLKANNAFRWVWSNDSGLEVASVVCAVNSTADGMTVVYSWRHPYGSDWSRVERHVWLDATACNYGGTRQWFRCPACHRRAAALYVAGNNLRCQKCARLSYATQRCDAVSRAWIKQRKIEAKLLDGWGRPKRMHRTTYVRLIEKLSECERRKDAALLRTMARMGFSFD